MNAVLIALTFLVSVGYGADESTVITDCVTEPKFPPQNSYVCYRTQIVRIGPFQKCATEKTLFRNISIFSQTPNYTIMYINSPGAEQGMAYSNELLCRWHIKCSDKQLLYFDIPEHSIEPKTNSNIFAKPVCVDYLKLYRDFGTQVTCGLQEPVGDMEPNELLVEFRSNTKLRFPGFSMRLVCFDPGLQSEGGCSSSGSFSRSKRAGVGTDEQLLMNTPPGELSSSTTQNASTPRQQIISYSASLKYLLGTLQILNGNGEVQTFHGIQYVVTYNGMSGVRLISASNTTVVLRGFGVLTVVNDTAYYEKFGIDPKFSPSPEEKVTIRDFLQAYESLLINDTAAVENDAGQHLRKRATTLSDSMSVNTVESSLNSCNAVLKSVAQSYFSLVSR